MSQVVLPWIHWVDCPRPLCSGLEVKAGVVIVPDWKETKLFCRYPRSMQLLEFRRQWKVAHLQEEEVQNWGLVPILSLGLCQESCGRQWSCRDICMASRTLGPVSLGLQGMSPRPESLIAAPTPSVKTRARVPLYMASQKPVWV